MFRQGNFQSFTRAKTGYSPFRRRFGRHLCRQRLTDWYPPREWNVTLARRTGKKGGGPVRNRTGIAGLGNRSSIHLSYGAAASVYRDPRPELTTLALTGSWRTPTASSPSRRRQKFGLIAQRHQALPRLLTLTSATQKPHIPRPTSTWGLCRRRQQWQHIGCHSLHR
jgi:hypothetical protein